MKTSKELRHENLMRLIQTFGSIQAIADRLGKSHAQISQLKTKAKDSKTGNIRGMGDDQAREIEEKLGLARGWMDNEHPENTVQPALSEENKEGFVRLEHLSARPSMGPGNETEHAVQIVQHLDVLQDWLTEEIGSTDPKKIKVLTATGRSMLPTIADRDLVFVDITRRSIDSPGIYVIDVHRRLLLKKVMIQSNGTIIIRSDNTEEYPDEERYSVDELQETIHICGKVMAWWTLKKG